MAEKNVQTNIILPEKLWNRAKARAAKDGRSFAEVVRRALTQYLMTREGGEGAGSKNPEGKGEQKMSMLVKVIYHLSEKGRIEAVKRNLPAQAKQEKFFEDPRKKTIDLPGFFVDEKGTPALELQEWHIETLHLRKRPAELDLPIESLDGVFIFFKQQEKKKRELEESLPQIIEEYKRISNPVFSK